MKLQKTLIATAVALAYGLSASAVFAENDHNLNVDSADSESVYATDNDLSNNSTNSESAAGDKGASASEDSLAVSVNDNDLSNNSDNSAHDSFNDSSDNSFDIHVSDFLNDYSDNSTTLKISGVVSLNELNSSVTDNEVHLHDESYITSEGLITEGAFEGAAGILQTGQSTGANTNIQQTVSVNAPASFGNN
ncbi:MAG: hypothetical protein EA349_01195 [Halomonadaceae bacterium]|nr:MAG: hypothetical protein EA349_01195 [Halomonadaceae bacterium]